MGIIPQLVCGKGGKKHDVEEQKNLKHSTKLKCKIKNLELCWGPISKIFNTFIYIHSGPCVR